MLSTSEADIIWDLEETWLERILTLDVEIDLEVDVEIDLEVVGKLGVDCVNVNRDVLGTGVVKVVGKLEVDCVKVMRDVLGTDVVKEFDTDGKGVVVADVNDERSGDIVHKLKSPALLIFSTSSPSTKLDSHCCCPIISLTTAPLG